MLQTASQQRKRAKSLFNIQWLKFIEDLSMVKPRNKGYDL